MARELTPVQQALLEDLVKIIRAYPLPENSPRLMTMEELSADTKLQDIMRGELQKLADMRKADMEYSNVELHGILESKSTPDWSKAYCTIHFHNGRPSKYMTIQEAVDRGYLKITDIHGEPKEPRTNTTST